MLFLEWRMLRRRWYAVLLGLAITVGLCAFAAASVPASYEAKAQLLLLPPKAAVEPTGNPYVNLSGLNGVSDALARAMGDSATQQTLVGLGAVPGFTVEPDPIAPGPIVVITVSHTDPRAVMRSLRVLVEQTPRQLRTMQTSQGVATRALITSMVLSQDGKATASIKSQLRAVLVAFAGGIGVTWLSTALLDSLLRRRRVRPIGHPKTGGESGADPGQGDPVADIPGFTPSVPSVPSEPSVPGETGETATSGSLGSAGLPSTDLERAEATAPSSETGSLSLPGFPAWTMPTQFEPASVPAPAPAPAGPWQNGTARPVKPGEAPQHGDLAGQSDVVDHGDVAEQSDVLR